MPKQRHHFPSILHHFAILNLLLVTLIPAMVSCQKSTGPDDAAAGPDTTSHNFTWTIDTLCDYGNYLKDVAIINENDIWAVGEIRLDGGNQKYNAVHWDGEEWNLVKIPVKVFNTETFIVSELNSIHAFDSNSIFVTNGGELIEYDGNKWDNWTFLFEDLSDTTFGSINNIWGTSSSNLYLVGNNGNITHYDGQSWQRLDSGTDVDLLDVWAAPRRKCGVGLRVYGICRHRVDQN
ncbi:MAG: hypothetical protein GF313_05530 [Caldithrix sp.]|nr:hypothetical protein [Caldithrix sp.]